MPASDRLVLPPSYAPWCPACQNLQPEWEKFAEWGEDLEVTIAKVDVTEQPGESLAGAAARPQRPPGARGF